MNRPPVGRAKICCHTLVLVRWAMPPLLLTKTHAL
jgi:hypothetical protein